MLCTDEYPQAAPNQQKALTGEMGGAAATSRRRRDAALDEIIRSERMLP